MIYFTLLNNLLCGTGKMKINGRYVLAGGSGGDGSPPAITVASTGELTLQTSNYWMYENIWNASGLTRVSTEGSYSGVGGTTYYQFNGVDQPALSVSTTAGHAPAAARWRWGFPTGVVEIKNYPSLIAGEKPGWANVGPRPAGIPVLLPDGTTSTVAPSGPTPNDFFPIALSSLSAGGGKTITSTFRWTHNETPTGRGHLAYDIWLCSSPIQGSGFSAPPITTEVMIQLDSWGSPIPYGRHPDGRNPGWYHHDVTLLGIDWHVYHSDTTATDSFNGEWRFFVFQPDATQVPLPLSSLDLAALLSYVGTVGGYAGWTSTDATATHVVSVELGIEVQDGTGDLTLWNFTVKP